MKRALLISVPVVLALAVALWLRGSEPPQVPFAPVTREAIVSTLSTNGKVEPVEWSVVRAEAPGTVDRVHVERGRTVAKGQILVSLSVTEAQADLATAQSRIAQARAELEVLSSGGRAPERAEIESGLARAMSDLQTSRNEVDALRRLVEKGAATRLELQAAEQALTRAELQIQALQRRRDSLVSAPDRSAAQARLQEAEAANATASQRIAQAQVRSPISGVLYSFDVRPGAVLNPGDEVARVGKLNRLRVVIYVDEPELGRVHAGLPVTITWDAMPGREWNGVVEKVPTQVTPLGTRQVGEVLATIENPELNLIPGTNVNVSIRSQAVESALTVPKEAIRRQSGSTGVFKLESGNKVAWQPVQVGVSSVTRSQITSGLGANDQVALAYEQGLSNGQIVQPTAR
jgi:HlyD family secretion protein